MKRILGLVVAGGLWLGLASAADAQFSLSVGNPYTGGFAIGAPYAGVYGGGFYGAPYASYGVVPGADVLQLGLCRRGSGPAGGSLPRLWISPVLRRRGLSPMGLLRRLPSFWLSALAVASGATGDRVPATGPF